MFLNPLNFYFAIFIMLVAITTALVFVRVFSDYYPASHNRFVVLDGLRGYLAMAVFIHHSALHYSRLKSTSLSNFYTNLGEASVALFFMITAFLFFGKLLTTKNKKDAVDRKIDWKHLYISRILRIMPLYVFSTSVIVFIVFILTNFTLNEPLTDFAKHFFKLIQFKNTILNGVDTGTIGSGVTWTLRWERSFYLALPFLAFFLRLNVSWIWLAIISALIIPEFLTDRELVSLSFWGGIGAVFVVQNSTLTEFFKKNIVGLVALLCLIFEINYFHSSYQVLALMMLTIFFIAIVSNNVLFKVLNSRASHFLGTISYSLYLLHGIVLFVVFTFVVGPENTKTLSDGQYWAVVGCCAVILILVSSITYHFIELPFLNMAKKFRSFSK